jgi:hypothetical protein
MIAEMIAEERSWNIGPYFVRQTVRPDNPYWPCYIVFRGQKLIGKQFSRPNESDCQWLEKWGGRYAEPAEYTYIGWTEEKNRRGPGRPRKVDAERELQEALAS